MSTFTSRIRKLTKLISFLHLNTGSSTHQGVTIGDDAVTAAILQPWVPDGPNRDKPLPQRPFFVAVRSRQEAGRTGCSGAAGSLEYCVSKAAGDGCGRDNGCWPDTPLSLRGPLSTFRLAAAPRQVHWTATSTCPALHPLLLCMQSDIAVGFSNGIPFFYV